MALFLIYTVDNVHPDPRVEARATYKAGDVLRVLRPSDYNPAAVIVSPWLIVNVTDRTDQQVATFIVKKPGLTAYGDPCSNVPRYRINLTAPVVAAALAGSRYLELTWLQAAPLVIDKTP